MGNRSHCQRARHTVIRRLKLATSTSLLDFPSRSARSVSRLQRNNPNRGLLSIKITSAESYLRTLDNKGRGLIANPNQTRTPFRPRSQLSRVIRMVSLDRLGEIVFGFRHSCPSKSSGSCPTYIERFTDVPELFDWRQYRKLNRISPKRLSGASRRWDFC